MRTQSGRWPTARKLCAAILALALALAPAAGHAQFTDQRTWAGTAAGTANAIAITVANYDKHLPGVVHRFIGAAPNTGAATINISGLGAVALRLPSARGPVALGGGEIRAGNVYEVSYDGTFYEIVSAQSANAQVDRSSSYTAASADCSTTQNLGGAGFYTVTFASSAGYAAGCVITLTNTSNARGRGVDANGITAFTLYPFQTVTLRALDGGNWSRTQPGRWKQHSPQLYVNAVAGSDNPLFSDCLAPANGACATFDGAIARVLDVDTVQASIQADCETVYNQTITLIFVPTVFTISGDLTTPFNCSIQPQAGGTIVNVQDHASLTIQGFYLDFPNNNGTTMIYSRAHSIVDFKQILFGNANGAVHVQAQDLATVNITGNYIVGGNSSSHINAIGHSRVTTGGNTVFYQSNPNIGVFYTATDGSSISSAGPVSFSSVGGSTISGSRYGIGVCSSLSLTGTAFPVTLSAGSVAGTCPSVSP